MDGMPNVSIVMPVYNAAPYLETAVFSILRQSHADLELICVNDCSTDESETILRRIAEKDGRVRVFRTPENSGAGNARNLGLSQTRGKWIGFVDADDEIPQDLLERAVARAEADGADEVVWGLREQIHGEDGRIRREREILPEAGVFTGGALPRAVAKLEEQTLFGYQWNSLYRGEILREQHITFPDDILYEDLFFNLDFIRRAKTLSTISYCGYLYKKRAGSVTHRFIPDYFALSEKRIEKMYAYLEENGALDRETKRILRDRMLRYTTSALARNAGAAAGLTRKEQLAQIRQIKASPILRKLLAESGEGVSAIYLPTAILLKYLPDGAAALFGKCAAKLK